MLYGSINLSTLGDTTVVPAIAGYRVRVLGYVISAAGAVSVQFKSGSNAISGPMSLVAGSNIATHPSASTEQSEMGVVQTNPGEAFVINLSAAVAVGGHVNYKYVMV